MLRYIARRLLLTVPILFVITVATFVLMSIVIGDPVLLILGPDSNADQATVDRLRQQLGVNRPLPLQYADWLRHILTGNFGRSFRSPIAVREAVLARLPVTLELTALALVLAIAIAVPLGITAALRPGSRLDLCLSGFAAISLSLPNFWLGILLIYLFALKLRLLPSAGYIAFTQSPVQNLKFMMLPTLTLAMGYIGSFTRYTRAVMVEVLEQDYIRTARAKGLRAATVLRRHALTNALIPVITVAGLEVAGLFGGAVVTETIFSLPGVGTLLTDSVLGRDLPMVQGIVLFITVAVIVTSLLVDILYAYLDPRVRSLYG
jgi:peptide/nickel transport system permease protein